MPPSDDLLSAVPRESPRLDDLAHLAGPGRTGPDHVPHRPDQRPRDLARPSPAAPQGRNRLLSVLPPHEQARLRSHLHRVDLEQRDLVYQAGDPIRHIYFPETAVFSLITTLEQGATVEVGTVGCEGMVGLPAFLTEGTSTTQGIVQIPGAADRMDVDAFARLSAAPSALHQLLLRYTHAFLTQVAQTAACNASHLVDQRCARWLLMTRDRVQGDEFPLTHEFLAFMLGVRRAGVTVAMRALQEAGLVSYRRGSVAIVDRRGLEAVSCECYRVVRAHYERLLPQQS